MTSPLDTDPESPEDAELTTPSNSRVSCAADACGTNDIDIQIGMAFQIKDDLFDYQDHRLIGKPTGNDIKEKKFTLPLIYALNQADPGERRSIIRSIKNGNRSQKVVNEVVRFVKKKGGIEYARERMDAYKDRALEILNEFPESSSREALYNLVEFTVSRNK